MKFRDTARRWTRYINWVVVFFLAIYFVVFIDQSQKTRYCEIMGGKYVSGECYRRKL